MKKCVFTSLVLVTQMISSMQAGNIPGLFNTGVNDNHTQLPSGSLEQHYVLTGMASPAYASQGIPGIWVEPADDAMWIAPFSGEIAAPEGEYIYMLTFDLSGLKSATAIISGQMAADNGCSIYLNGVATQFNYAIYGGFADFVIKTGFLPKVNTLEFHVVNDIWVPWDNNPSGLLVQNLSGSAQLIPEPVTFALLGLGGLLLRSRINSQRQ